MNENHIHVYLYTYRCGASNIILWVSAETTGVLWFATRATFYPNVIEETT